MKDGKEEDGVDLDAEFEDLCKEIEAMSTDEEDEREESEEEEEQEEDEEGEVQGSCQGDEDDSDEEQEDEEGGDEGEDEEQDDDMEEGEDEDASEDEKDEKETESEDEETTSSDSEDSDAAKHQAPTTATAAVAPRPETQALVVAAENAMVSASALANSVLALIGGSLFYVSKIPIPFQKGNSFCLTIAFVLIGSTRQHPQDRIRRFLSSDCQQEQVPGVIVVPFGQK